MNIGNITSDNFNLDGNGKTPVRHTKNKKFKWVLYARKLRNKNLNINT